MKTLLSKMSYSIQRHLQIDYDLEFSGYTLINYKNLNVKESLKILEYRNHDLVRSFMVNTKIISKKAHVNFIKKMPIQNAGYWAIKKNGEIIGSISLVDYDPSEKSLVVGNFLKPDFIGSGQGVLANYFMHYLAFEKVECKKVTAIVKTRNINANRLNSFFGGKVVESFNKNRILFNKYEFYSKSWFSNVKSKAKKVIENVF